MKLRGTTILAVTKDGHMAMAGDGQVTMGESVVMKGNAKKVRRLLGGQVVCGFAGSTADAFTLEERFEGKLREFGGDITRSAVELAKDWRTDRALRKLEAMLLVMDKEKILVLSGTGDVIEPEGGAIAIGSGGSFALAAAKAYLDGSDLDAAEIAKRSLGIAADICVYTNHNIIVEEIV
ncbi:MULTISPECIES: ATP-dependent protease subunit HslV [unclassified Oceanispirochaeta]|uniref:ATP-dependent protease subunit HslV n=1 Tax=unclassified Oceanispirochaeta TaxID=2635722 RepID=UPI000E09C5B2|nr:MULTISPECIES: ATP-dependent protease subunit HslV [unclassified Oceanispirochaeta]MBF9016145.1 ATP-dependent protease subunit HslV [Oceanispirochaeta sp. M2]NPD72607.1 ATP-dependent protease subunit HslV [Oceanispirochaeta sp. M1]RDG31759.1 ATP-dependent protease subunit HslV [Oceanispirochaeta sp. M1]